MLLKWVLVSEKRHTNLLACVLEKPKNSGIPEDLESEGEPGSSFCLESREDTKPSRGVSRRQRSGFQGHSGAKFGTI